MLQMKEQVKNYKTKYMKRKQATYVEKNFK